MFELMSIFAAQWRTRRENPVWVHSAPWRLGRGARVVFLLQMAFALATPVLLALGISMWDRPTFMTEFDLLCVAVVSALLLPWNLYLLRSPYDNQDRLETLLTTPLTRRQITFGLYFWPAATSVVMGLGLMIAAHIGFILASDGFGFDIFPGYWLGAMWLAMFSTMMFLLHYWARIRKHHLLLVAAMPVVFVAMQTLYITPVVMLGCMGFVIFRNEAIEGLAFLLTMGCWIWILAWFADLSLRHLSWVATGGMKLGPPPVVVEPIDSEEKPEDR